jgi:hypothetical protein
MAEAPRPALRVACEGHLDGAVLAVLTAAHGLEIGPVYDMGGKQRLDDKLRGYVNAARFAPWIVQRDLDDDAVCAPELVRRLVSYPPSGLRLIVAVRQVEAWLLADRQAIADHLRISPALVPELPETLADAKAHLVDLARRSRSRDIREDVVPALGSGRRVGPGYTSRLTGFVRQQWSFRRAARVAPSLATLVARIERFERTGAWEREQTDDSRRM